MEGEEDLGGGGRPLERGLPPPPNLPLPPRTSRKSPPVQSGNLTRFDGRRGLAGSSFSGREVRCGGWCGFALRLWGNVPDVLYMTVVSKKSAGYPADFLGQCKTYVTGKRSVRLTAICSPIFRTVCSHSSQNALKVLEGVLGGHFFQEASPNASPNASPLSATLLRCGTFRRLCAPCRQPI